MSKESSDVIIKTMTIDKNHDEVYDFFINIINWEKGGALKNIHKVDTQDLWEVYTPIGKARIKLKPNRQFGMSWAKTLFVPALRIALIAMNAAVKDNVLFEFTNFIFKTSLLVYYKNFTYRLITYQKTSNSYIILDPTKRYLEYPKCSCNISYCRVIHNCHKQFSSDLEHC
jgi:hypothetical protein